MVSVLLWCKCSKAHGCWRKLIHLEVLRGTLLCHTTQSVTQNFTETSTHTAVSCGTVTERHCADHWSSYFHPFMS